VYPLILFSCVFIIYIFFLGVISTTTPELTQDVCIAKGCNNAAVQHPEWDNEYCSVSCTYKHCKYVYIILQH